ncbi:LacI family DNA-binding transcriptional regulator [Bacillus timonensis]|uniref:LacI family DNA-binding transcriptional regulator n=1 Tax=Bacillus timonensis TaxID=1033734 RepID=UPI00028A1471|nr:LacI family DNA-binding transcriptional regulator [Bacillus timonensis]
MATIRDVSKLAQVSVATVSRVLNGGYVNHETKKRVTNAMQQLNYKPSMIAQSLNSKKSKTIALVIPNITNPYFSNLAKAVDDVAKENGYKVLLFNTDDKDENIDYYLNIARQKYIDGLIMATPLKDYKSQSDVPIVVLDRVKDKSVDSVVSNNRNGGKIATQHLIDIGCRKIAHIKGTQDITTAQERYQGYLEVLSEYNLINESLVVEGNFDLDSAKDATGKLLLEQPDIDGIFAGNDLMAVGALKAIKKMGKRIPEDVALIGFDGIDFSRYTEPELSTIAQPIYDMGALSTRVLLDKINGLSKDITFHELDVSLIKRGSTKRQSKGE